MKKDAMIDAISAIDEKYVIEYVQYETKLSILKNRKQKKTRNLLICAACLALVVCLLAVSLPLSFIVLGSKPVQALGNEIMENVLFPLDQEAETPDDPDEPTPPKQSLLQINWIEWKLTENLFYALGAGTDDSVIDKLQASSGNGLVGESMQNLGDFLGRLYEYYIKHKDEIDAIIGETENDSELLSETETDPLPPLEPGVIRVDEQNVQYQLDERGKFFIVLGYASQDNQSNDYRYRIIIPEEIEGIPVNRIADKAFQNDQFLQEVVLPDGIYQIGAYAFSCPRLKTINLPESLLAIGTGAFKNTLIAEIVIPPNISDIPAEMCANCTELKKVIFKGNVQTIGGSAFWCCASLQEIDLPESLLTLGASAFYNSGLTKINYNGTKAEWTMHVGSGDVSCTDHQIQVICTDGKVLIE